MQLIFALLIALIIYVVQLQLYQKYWDRQFSVRLHFDKPFVNCGEKAKLYEVINNDKSLPMPVVYTKFATSNTFIFADITDGVKTDHYYRNDAFSILGHQKVTRQLEFTTSKRGYYFIKTADIIAKDFFITKTFANKYDTYADIYVFPLLLPINNFRLPFTSITGDIISNKFAIEDPFMYKGIREYETYDNYRHINWKATAKHGNLMVNSYHNTSSYSIRIILNLETNSMFQHEETKEISISMASTLATELIKYNIPVSLCTNGCDIVTNEYVYSSTGNNQKHLQQLNMQLARINTIAPHKNPHELLDETIAFSDSSTTYILISNYRKDDFINTYTELSHIHNMYLVIPEYKDVNVNVTCKNLTVWEVDRYE